jgi:putative ABC transport system permease protein
MGASVFLVVVLEGLLRHLDDLPRADGSERRLIVRSAVSFREPIPATYAPRIEAIPGVQGICGLVLYWGIYKELTPENFFAKLAMDADKIAGNYPEIQTCDPLTGEPSEELLANFIRERRGASAGKALYEKYGWKLGDRIVFRGIGAPDVEVTLVSAYDGPENSTFYFHREYLEELMGNPRQVSFFNVVCDSADSIPRVAAAIDGMFENSQAPTVTETEKAFQGQFVAMLGNVHFLLRSIAIACGFAMVCVAANTLALTARERANEIAVLKSLGYTPGLVLTLLLTEVAILCGLAALLGSGGAKLLFTFDGPWRTMGRGFLYGFTIPVWLALTALPAAILVGWAAALVPFCRVALAPIAPALRRAG